MADFRKIIERIDLDFLGHKRKGITIDDVEEIWEKNSFWKIQNSKLATDLLEFAVITNASISIKILQRSFNALNKNILIEESGVLDDSTVESINSYKFYKSLFKMMNILQGVFYLYDCEDDEKSRSLMEIHSTKVGVPDKKDFFRKWIDSKVR